MRIELSVYEVRKLSEKLYLGASSPITSDKLMDKPFHIDWWESHQKKESVSSDRHRAAMLLYLDLALKVKPAPLQDSFPARFDCNDKKSLRPDKGVIKAFLENKLLTHRLIDAQLVFDLTVAGKLYAKAAGEKYVKR